MQVPAPRTQRLIVLLVVALAASLMAVAVVIYRSNPSNSGLPAAVQNVIPAQGDEVLSQVDITVDLAAGYTGSLQVNGIDIPDDQLQRVEGLNLFSFRPDQDKAVTEFLPDQNCARIEIWQIATGPTQTQIYTWCFATS